MNYAVHYLQNKSEVQHIARCKHLDIPERHAQQAPHDKTRHMTEVMLRDSAVNNKETASP
jgi:hypothetical protein